tara:strand:+ start:260 stop:2182 length:1923 start_codon:yes stop_codon:yes gene_type:complete
MNLPDDPQILEQCINAQAALESGNLTTAEQLFRSVTSASPQNIDAWIGLFKVALEHGDLANAGENLDRAIGLKPGDIELLAARASLHIRFNEPEPAIDKLSKIILNDPSVDAIWIALFSTLMTCRSADDSLIHIMSLEVSVPPTPAVVIEYAKLELAAGHRQSAEDRIRAVVDEAPNDPDRLLLLAKFLSEIGEEAEAGEIYARLRDEFPNSVPILLAAAFSEQHDNASVSNALFDLDRVINLEPNNGDALRTMAECLSRIARYDDALTYSTAYLRLIPDPSAEQLFFHAKLQKNAGNSDTALEFLERASLLLSRNIDEATNINAKQSELAKLARVEVARANRERAMAIFSELVSFKPLEISNLATSKYLESTEKLLEDLRRLVAGRDVFLLAHGPSIGDLKQWIEQFDLKDTCFGAVSAFRILEKELLQGVGRQVDIVLQTHYRGIAPRYDQLREYLSREGTNLFITARWALERLGRACPTRQEIETTYHDKLLYIGGSGGIEPATPHNPLKFVFGNSLSILVPLTAMAGARRIFLFGADGISKANNGPAKHFGEGNPDFRFDFEATDIDALTGGLRADTVDFSEAVEIGLISLEAIFGFKRPPIYNVSPDSAIDAFPKIGYQDALAMCRRSDETVSSR